MWLMYNDPQFLEGRQPYSAHGIDRQAQAEALEAICRLYKKILKINITLDSYEIITMDPKEKIKSMGFSEKISEWFKDFGRSGQVHKDDLENYLRNTVSVRRI